MNLRPDWNPPPAGPPLNFKLNSLKDPENPRKRIYAVFDKVQHVSSNERTLGTETRGSADVADNKAVRTSMAAALNEKVSATFSSTSDGLGDLFKHLGANSGGPVPKAKSKAKAKNKKVLTQDEQNRRDFDKSLEKPLGQLVHVN